MDIKKYISSGILELYVIGVLSEAEQAEVESMASKHIEIQQEIFQIANNLEKYARMHGVKVDAGVEQKLFNNLPEKVNKGGGKREEPVKQNASLWKTGAIIFGLMTIALAILLYHQNEGFKQDLQIASDSLAICDSLKTQEANKTRIYAEMNLPETKIVELTPTDNFPKARLRLYYNKENNSNILQWVEPPGLEPGTVYQLWYFDEENVPKPLETFDNKKMIWELTFKNEATIYAFTIEPEGGSETPTLANLIGTVSI